MPPRGSTTAAPIPEDQSSGNDLQECDFAPLQAEAEPEINWAARKVSRQPACDDRHAVLLLHGEGFTGVGVSGRGFCLPSLDGGQTGVGMTFIFHNGVRRKPPRDSLAVELIGGEGGGAPFGKGEAVRHGGLHLFRETTMTVLDQ